MKLKLAKRSYNKQKRLNKSWNEQKKVLNSTKVLNECEESSIFIRKVADKAKYISRSINCTHIKSHIHVVYINSWNSTKINELPAEKPAKEETG